MKEKQDLSRVYWKILDSYMNLHPYLKINIFYRKYHNIVVRFSEINENGSHKLVALGLAKSLTEAITKASGNYPDRNNKTVKSLRYQITNSQDLKISQTSDLSSLILNRQCRIEITARKNSEQEVEKIIEIESTKKVNGIIRKCEQNAFGKEQILELILKASKLERKLI